MTSKTHLLGGILAGQMVALAAGGQDVLSASIALIVGGAAAGSLIPDIDHLSSAISHSSLVARATSIAVSGVTHHRGVIHTPVFALGFAAMMAVLSVFMRGIGRAALLGMFIGLISHLLLDTFNPSGIMWLWPVSRKRIHLARITTGTLGEWLFAIALGVANLWLAAAAFPDMLPKL